jgi:dihydroorotate dehydrogenase subfamily 1
MQNTEVFRRVIEEGFNRGNFDAWDDCFPPQFEKHEYGLPSTLAEFKQAIELNLSCPNVEEAPETSAELVAAARLATRKPLYAKLSPATWDIAESARAVAGAGADGLSLINTIRGLALERSSARPVLARGAGGYSGPALKPIALACIWACASAVDLPIVGMGGVASAGDVEDFVAAGASSVALGTWLFVDPWAPRRIRSELGHERTAPVTRHTAEGRHSASARIA